MSDKPAPVDLAAIAAGEDITRWQRTALDKLAAQIGIPGTINLPDKDAVLRAIQARVEEHTRAVEPEPPSVVARIYRVVGPCQVAGTKPGKTFAHIYTPEHEAALIEGGHIQIAKETA